MKPAKFGKGSAKKRGNKQGGFGRGRGSDSSGEDQEKESDKDAVEAQKPTSARRPGSDRAEGKAAEPLDAFTELLEEQIPDLLPSELAAAMSQDDISQELKRIISKLAKEEEFDISDGDASDLHTYLLNEFFAETSETDKDLAEKEERQKIKKGASDLEEAKSTVQPLLMEHIDASAASELPREELAEQIGEVVGELLVQEKINLNLKEQRSLVSLLLNDMLGLGPLEPLLADEAITDILVNGPNQVYIERHGKLELTDVHFRDERHLLNIATRIVTAIGRRVDESSPICDARLADGSRVNVIIPPLAIDGSTISIRKFAKQKITLDLMINQANISPEMGTVMKIAARSRLNILISGGTGSGKTTLLNALSRMIDLGERIVTIEDAAELQLQQPHVVRLETRPPNLEGEGEVTMRDLVKNSLRMRPDRVILGEIRGSEAVDMLQAMNTGHDGSLGTVHANSPREALTRLENMVGLAGINLPAKAVRTQISNALDLVIQISRMRDGMRRVQNITEVVGMEGDVITTQDLFYYKFTGEDSEGNLKGDFLSTGVRPVFMEKAAYFGLGRPLLAAMG